ncbi:hypothetical protein KSF78_0003957 [Schistosoma japonicum]|nr:hypothetical protein KSF78_0003957 [Schistosoma japonicum]
MITHHTADTTIRKFLFFIITPRCFIVLRNYCCFNSKHEFTLLKRHTLGSLCLFGNHIKIYGDQISNSKHLKYFQEIQIFICQSCNNIDVLKPQQDIQNRKCLEKLQVNPRALDVRLVNMSTKQDKVLRIDITSFAFKPKQLIFLLPKILRKRVSSVLLSCFFTLSNPNAKIRNRQKLSLQGDVNSDNTLQ